MNINPLDLQLLSDNTTRIDVGLYATACMRFMGLNRQFTVSVPEGIEPTVLADAFRRLGCAVQLS